MEHVTIFRQSGRYAGWPANYGIWSWEDEIVVGFIVGHVNPSGGFHARDRQRPFVTKQARSLDGGVTWNVVDTPCESPGGRALSADEHMRPDLGVAQATLTEPVPRNESPIDFSHPDFALMCARSGLRAGAASWYYVSHDRCATWEGPFALPDFGQLGIAARTDYHVNGTGDCSLFLTATNPDGEEGRVFHARTIDGGMSFQFVSWIGPEVPNGFTIMPATANICELAFLTALRCRNDKGKTPAEKNWIDLYRSDDDGKSWKLIATPVQNTGVGGNPPSMMGTADGRLCLTYGCRDAPRSIMATLSGDAGHTWETPITLRSGADNHDIGYPRSVQRKDGKIVTVYYFNDASDGERYIEAAIWKP